MENRKNKRFNLIVRLIVVTLIVVGFYLLLKDRVQIIIVDENEFNEDEISNYNKIDVAEDIGLFNVNSFQERYNKSVILFTATWCGPCEYLSNILKEQAIGYKNIEFFEIDIDSNRDLAGNLEVKITPSIVMIDGNRAAYESNIKKDDIVSDLNFFSIIGVSNLPVTYNRID